MKRIYDCIVVGTGGVGSAAAYFAARKGWSVVGLDRFPPGHDRGSSHGQTRIIRQAYFEHPDYVPLVLDAYQLWREIEANSGESLFQQTGLLEVGHPDGPIIQGIRRCADEHNLPLRTYDSGQLRDAFPMFQCRDDDVGLFEEVAGFLRVEKCVTTFARLATQQGAELIDPVIVRGWASQSGTLVVNTDCGDFHGHRLIFSAGPWTGHLLPEWKDHLRVLAKHQHWFRFQDRRLTLEEGCPTFFFETDQGFFYGFPALDGATNKIAEHSGGTPIDDPLKFDRSLDGDDLDRVQDFTHQYFNMPRGIHSDHSVCFYTMSPDEHFIIDVVDRYPIAVAAGLSGHGFKFTPVLGQALAEMVEGQFRDDMEFLRTSRLSAPSGEATSKREKE